MSARTEPSSPTPRITNNADLVADCKILWDAKVTLEGTSNVRHPLDWSDSTSISDWEGVTVDGSPKRVTKIYLQFNGRPPNDYRRLRGGIPASYGSLSALVELNLSWNYLRGSIPSELGNLTNLVRLVLSSNNLSGQIPTTIGNLTKLETLDLSNNQLSGPIPAQIWTLTNLTALRLHSNGLTGEIPPEIKNLSRLKTLGLHINKLTGGIPPEIGQLLQLENLYLYNNPLGGSIPSTLGQLTKLWRLDLRSSDLTGIIPQELENLPLTHLELSANNYTGCIPNGLQDVQYNDIDLLMVTGLSLCDGTNAPPTDEEEENSNGQSTSEENGGGSPFIGGGPPSGPIPSDADFGWTVTGDIDPLAPGNDEPTGLWGDGKTLWVGQNGSGSTADGIFVYDIASGDRRSDLDFELDETNRAPRGLWSDEKTMWVTDSGQNRIFAYGLVSKERLEEREIELISRNGYARGLWSDGERLWVLDSDADAVFLYDIETRQHVGEYALHSANDDPHGIWSDRVGIWISDGGARELFAYRVSGSALVRESNDDFTGLSRAGNNSPRGIWSDGDLMYVVDSYDERIYTYNMPDAIDARLASLALSDVDIGEFSSLRTEYTGVPDEGLTETTVVAVAAQSDATVVIAPPDTDDDRESGHQVAVEEDAEVTATVTSPDGTRNKVYRVRIRNGAGTEAAPVSDCGTLALTIALPQGGDFVVVPAGANTTVVDLFGGTDVAIVWKYNRATRAWDLSYIPARNRNNFAITAEDLLWVVSPRAQILTVEGTPSLIPSSAADLIILPLREGRDFAVVPAGSVSTTAADLFGSTDVTIVRKYNRATRAWDLSYIPARNRNNFAITAEDLLWVVSPRAQTLTMEGTPPPTPPVSDCGTLALLLALRQGGDFVAMPAGANTTVVDLFGGTDVTIVWKYNRATRAWDLFYIPARNRNNFAITAEDLLWVVSPRAQTLTVEGTPPPAPPSTAELNTLTLREGRDFVAVPAGVSTTATDLFGSTDVTIVWKYNRATRAWDLFYIPARNRNNFAITAGDILWVASPRAQTLTG